MTVAVLYCDKRGPYPTMPDVDAWDESRDARNYDNFFPVVAHPPCGPWGRLQHLCRHPEQRALALHSLSVVRARGGVLEHPAQSHLWREQALPLPGAPPDAWGGVTIEIAQCEYGHVARKRTWIYCVGIPAEALNERPPFPGREPTHWVSGGRGRAGKKAKTTPVPPGIKVCSAQQRRRTPPLLATWLVSLAEKATPP